MTKLVKTSELFDIEFPKTMVFADQNKTSIKKGIPLISTKGINNGVLAYIKENADCFKYASGNITVALKGSALEAYLQPTDFYCLHQVAVLRPKVKMSRNQRLFYCNCIKKNKFRYNYGRQADVSLKDILLPALNCIPDWVANAALDRIDNSSILKNSYALNTDSWKFFNLIDLFKITKGKSPQRQKPGNVQLVTTTSLNNGIQKKIAMNDYQIYDREQLTVAATGSIGSVFYHGSGFFASGNVNVLEPKFILDPYIAMFLNTVIIKEKFRFNYGRTWSIKTMLTHKIKLPVDESGAPNLQFMSDYIRSLPYSSHLKKSMPLIGF